MYSMFNNKKLRNTFWLALFAVSSPLWLIVDWSSGHNFETIANLISGLGFFMGLYVFIMFIVNWRIWPQKEIKVIGILFGLISLFLCPFILLVSQFR